MPKINTIMMISSKSSRISLPSKFAKNSTSLPTKSLPPSNSCKYLDSNHIRHIHKQPKNKIFSLFLQPDKLYSTKLKPNNDWFIWVPPWVVSRFLTIFSATRKISFRMTRKKNKLSANFRVLPASPHYENTRKERSNINIWISWHWKNRWNSRVNNQGNEQIRNEGRCKQNRNQKQLYVIARSRNAWNCIVIALRQE